MFLKLVLFNSKFFIAISLCFLLSSCVRKNSKKETEKLSGYFKKDSLTLKGTFYWIFNLMGSTQESVHTFYADSIVYQMKGKIYDTKYTMYKLSFDNKLNKWVGQDKDSVVYTLFFKSVTDSSLVLYKRKCKTNGLQEAMHFEIPEINATEDHGWNLYTRKNILSEENFPFKGTYKHKKDKIILSDNVITYNNNAYKKMSYHKGERRWVGKSEKANDYLQVFHSPIKNTDSLKLTIKKFKDLEKMYKTKYNEIQFINFKKYD